MEFKRFKKCDPEDISMLWFKLEQGFERLSMSHVRLHLAGDGRVFITTKERFLEFIKKEGGIKGSAQILLDAYDSYEVDFVILVTNMLPLSLDSYTTFFRKDGVTIVRKVAWSETPLWIDHGGVIDGEEPCSLVNNGETWNLVAQTTKSS